MFGFLRRREQQQDDPGLIASGGKPRDPRWQSWLKKHLVGKSCVVCGATEGLTGHHVIPFHEDPSKELDPDNVDPVCIEGCHFVVAHLHDWRLTNPDFRKDAALLLAQRRAAKEKRYA